MADYYPVLARAIASLDSNAPDQRRAVYERARKALVVQLRGYDPPLSETEITRERLALEDAVRRLESEARTHPNGRSAESPPASPSYAAAFPAAASPRRAPLSRTNATGSTAGDERSAPTSRPPAAASVPEEKHAEPSEPARREWRPQPPASAPRTVVTAHDTPVGKSAAEPVDEPVSEPQTAFGPAWPPSNGDAAPAHSRWPAIAAAIVVLVVAAIGGGAYVARDQLSHMLAANPTQTKGEGVGTVTGPPPKTTERIGSEDSAAPPASATTAAEPAGPAAASPGGSPNTTVARTTAPAPSSAPAIPPAVAQAPASERAILYEETPDRQSGNAYTGKATWKVSEVAGGEDHSRHTQLEADVDVPDRHMQLTLVIKRNLDPTLPASHTIDLQFKLAGDVPNGGIANVPGILFKPTEQAAGTALAGLSVRVMSNFFLIGLSSTPTELMHNLEAMRQNGWIDLPILYENGRRAVLTIQKGDAGSKAFDEAIAAWQREAATADSGASTGGTPAGGKTNGTPDTAKDGETGTQP